MKEKFCARCTKKIEDSEKYLKINLYENKKVTEIRFIHFKCWNLEVQQRKVIKQCNDIILNAKDFLKKKQEEIKVDHN